MSRWPLAELGEVCEIVGGGTPSRSVPSYFGGDIPWATPTDVTSLEAPEITQTREGITPAGLAASSARLLPAGSVLLTSRATIGFTAVTRAPMATNQGFANLIPGPRITAEFLAFWLPTQKATLLQLAGGTTFKEISKGNLKRISVPLPPLYEQRRIVDLLNRAAGIRRLREAALAKARETIPALFLSMFGDPVRNPMGWPMLAIGEAGRVQLGRQRAPKYQTGTMTKPYVRVANVYEDRIDLTDLLSMDFDASDHASYRLQSGDILLNEGQSIELVGRPAMWRGELEDCCFQNTLVRFQTADGVTDPEFTLAHFLWFFRHGAFSQIASKTSNVAHLGAGRFARMQMMVPPIDQQRTFAARARDLRSIITQQERALAIARDTERALMARLLG